MKNFRHYPYHTLLFWKLLLHAVTKFLSIWHFWFTIYLTCLFIPISIICKSFVSLMNIWSDFYSHVNKHKQPSRRIIYPMSTRLIPPMCQKWQQSGRVYRYRPDLFQLGHVYRVGPLDRLISHPMSILYLLSRISRRQRRDSDRKSSLLPNREIMAGIFSIIHTMRVSVTDNNKNGTWCSKNIYK